MMDLSLYERAFDRCYPKYAAGRYESVKALTERFTPPQQPLRILDCDEFQLFASLLEPLIEIKNWKSQIPFPTDVKTVLRSLIQLKQCAIPPSPLSGEPERLFYAIIDQRGFELQTVSAVFHFCHPGSFPIVDKKAQAACGVLKGAYASEFGGLKRPAIPALNTSPHNKLEKYRDFVAFIERVVQLQRDQHGGAPDYRFVDRAFMVLGEEHLRQQAENSRQV